MSRPSQPSGSASNGATCVSASSANALAATTSVGSTTGNESGFSSRSSSAILPPTSTVVRAAAEVLEHAELVLDLGAAGDEHERPLDLAEQPAEVLELGEQQQPRVGRQQLRDADGRGVRAVRRAECVVDVEVASLRELARELRVVLGLAGVEAGVLEHLDPLVREQPAQVLAHRLDPERRVLALRAAEMRADADRSRRRARAAARASAARRGCACRRRPRRPRAERSGRRGRGRPCRRRRRHGPSGRHSPQSSLPIRSTSRHQ